MAAAAKLPWHPSGRGRRSSLGKRTKRAKALKESGEELWSDMARERVSSKASLRAHATSLGKLRRFAGTLKLEISSRSQLPTPFEEWCMMELRAWAATLPGVMLPGIEAGDNMMLLTSAAIKGARKHGEGTPLPSA